MCKLPKVWSSVLPSGLKVCREFKYFFEFANQSHVWASLVYFGYNTNRVNFPRKHPGEEQVLVEAVGQSSTEKSTAHFPPKNQKYPSRDTWCTLPHCKLMFSKLPDVVSINKVIFLCHFTSTNIFLPFISLLLCVTFIFISQNIAFQKIKIWFSIQEIWDESLVYF